MKKKIQAMMNIHVGEGRKVFFLFTLFFINSFGSCLGLNACESLFIRQFGINNISIGFIFTSLITIALSLSLNFFYAAFSIQKAVLIVFTMAIGLLAANIFLVKIGYLFFIASIFIFTYAFFTILRSVLLNISDKVNDIRQTKRLFPVFSSGAMLGTGIAGVCTRYILRITGNTENLYFIWIGLLFAGMFLAVFVLDRFGNLKQQSVVKNSFNFTDDMKISMTNFCKDPMFLLMGLLSFLTFFLVLHFDFIYMFNVNQQTTDRDAVTAVFGTIRGISNIAAFILQFFITSRLINRFGATGIFQIFPPAFFISWAVMAVKFSFAPAVFGRLTYYITKEAFHFPSFQPFFNALSEKIRDKAIIFVSNILSSLGSLSAGLMLLFFVKSGLVSPWQSVFVSLLLSGLMIFYALLVRNAYINNLLINLDENSPRKLDMLESLKNLNENEADKHLLPLLKGENEQMAVFALETLSSFKTTKYAEEVAGLIDIHFNPKMTRRIFNYFSGECSQKILDKSELIRLKHKEETKIFYLTWAQKYLSFISLQKNLLPFLFDPSFRIQIRSAFLLYISGNHELALQAETFIRNAVSKSSRENVCTILDELANTGDEKLSIFLPDLKLKIDGPALAKNYINALLHISSAAIQEELLEYVVPRREYHGFYIKKIAASKNRDILKLVNAAVISAMPAYSDNTKEFAFLINCLSVMPEKSEACQLEIINFLKKIINVPGMEFSRFRIAECIPAFNLPYNENLKSEIKEIIACENNNLFRDYDDIASFREYDTVFSGIFHDEKNKIIKKRLRFIFNFLNYLYKEQKIDTPLFGLNSPDNNIRASSLEAVENIIDKDIFDMIAPVLENKISSHSPRPASDIMRSLLAVDNYWLNSLGIYFTKVLKLKDLKKEINDYNSYSQFVEKLKKETIAAL